MKSLDKKIKLLEEMINDEDKMNKAVYEVIASSDLNKDQQLSRAEFQKVLQDFGIGDFEAIDDLFTSLDRDDNGFINFREFRYFFRAQTRIKLLHLKELRAAQIAKAKAKKKAGEASAGGEAGPGDKKNLKKWKSTRN